MKRKFCAILVSLIIASAVFSAIACGSKLTKETAVGTWRGELTFNVDKCSKTLLINADGSYSSETAAGNDERQYSSGSWEIKNGELYLYINSDKDKIMIYEYKDGKLTQESHSLSKIK
jgi:hypothetical protein